MRFRQDFLRLYLVTDSRLCSEYGLERTVEAAVRSGVSMVQLRNKRGDTQELVSQARSLLKVLHPYRVPLVINDDVEAAIQSEAHGVHLGQKDTNPREAREKMGCEKILGLSCGDIPSVSKADPKTVDYIGIGPVFQTQTKADHDEPVGLSGLARLCELAKAPVVAIGGLKPEHCDAVFQAGAKGMAVVSAICGQPDPSAAALRISQKIQTLCRHDL